MNIIWRIIGAVSIILGIIGKKKKKFQKTYIIYRKNLEHNRLKPNAPPLFV